MSIVRVVHNKENPYVILNKQSLWDSALSLKAVGLWARLLSRPDDWKISVRELAKSCNLNKDTIGRLINELIEAGYAHKIYRRVEGNRFGGTEYHIFETKISKEEIKKMFPQPAFSDPEISDPEKPDILSNDLTNPLSEDKEEKTDIKKETKQRKAAEPPSAEADSLANILLSKVKEHLDPNFQPTAFEKWGLECDKLLKTRPIEEIMFVIDNLPRLKSSYLKNQFKRPSKLLKHFSDILTTLKDQNSATEPLNGQNKASEIAEKKRIIERNRLYAKDMFEMYPKLHEYYELRDTQVFRKYGEQAFCFQDNTFPQQFDNEIRKLES